MYVIKRDGRIEEVKFDKITSRIKPLCQGLNEKYIDPIQITRLVVKSVTTKIKTSDLDKHAARIAASLSLVHPDYLVLGGRIAMSDLQKNTVKTFSECIEKLYNYHNSKLNKHVPLVSKEFYDIVMSNKEEYNNIIVHNRDLINYDYFGAKTLERSYLHKIDDEIIETPQYMLLRVAIGFHKDDINATKETYELTSQKFFTHATPTLFNSGTVNNQMASCYLLRVADDSIQGIMKTASNMAILSKHAGGLGIHFQDIRAKNSYIAGTNGKSKGIVPFIQIYDKIAKGINQGGKRPGSAAIYLDIWHADIEEFINLKNPHKSSNENATNLLYAILINDEFMRRVQAKEMWSLFCPNECPKLKNTYGKSFVEEYCKYEKEETKIKKQIKALSLWTLILESMILTGGPYLLNKDMINQKSNQKNLGILSGSNLCAEIIIYTDKDEIGTCNLASIGLPRFVDTERKIFNYEKLIEVTRVITRNLNKIIDCCFYPIKESKQSNLNHRPIGIGIQGLYDAIIMLGYPMTSDDGKKINKQIIEAMYYGFITESCELAKKYGPYKTFKGSPASEGKLQFDLWEEAGHFDTKTLDPKYDWPKVKDNVVKYGLRNSLGIALMPTASTSNIMGYTECFQAPITNVYVRGVLSGEFQIINKYLVHDLDSLGLWTKPIKTQIMRNNGSVQDIAELPDWLKRKYLTMYEEKGQTLIEMEADRAPFICHTQSGNRFIGKIDDNKYDFKKLSSMLLFAHQKGLKTISYYIRTPPKREAVQFTVEPEEEDENCIEEICITCQS